ncbi:unnamed protein product [Didymodactylos carnosus]|uniref:SWIM-type domain-containing protein n=1 Tax=Didymodactylos carnosus TaxID=1234261 RepID=A0A8S2E6G6_9BILA|nr:unnamed protein product [Didymodactylos carnosus]CAF3945490.1 unnamed protein product [Didymodactylos carnosus]
MFAYVEGISSQISANNQQCTSLKLKTTRRLLAHELIKNNGVHHVPALGLWLVKHQYKEYTVKMYPKETCSCRSKQICVHTDAVRLSLNRELNDDSITITKTISKKASSGKKTPRKQDQSRNRKQRYALNALKNTVQLSSKSTDKGQLNTQTSSLCPLDTSNNSFFNNTDVNMNNDKNNKSNKRQIYNSSEDDSSPTPLKQTKLQQTRRRNLASYDLLADGEQGGRVIEKLKHLAIYQVDLHSLITPKTSVTDTIIDACLKLLAKQLNKGPNNNTIIVQQIGETRVDVELQTSPFLSSAAIQLIIGVLAEPGHFVAFTCTSTVLSIFNSLYSSGVTPTQWKALSGLTSTNNSDKTIQLYPTQQQSFGSNNCSLFAIAVLTELHIGQGYHNGITFDESKLRSHALMSLEKNEMEPFPKTNKNCVRQPTRRISKKAK